MSARIQNGKIIPQKYSEYKRGDILIRIEPFSTEPPIKTKWSVKIWSTK